MRTPTLLKWHNRLRDASTDRTKLSTRMLNSRNKSAESSSASKRGKRLYHANNRNSTRKSRNMRNETSKGTYRSKRYLLKSACKRRNSRNHNNAWKS